MICRKKHLRMYNSCSRCREDLVNNSCGILSLFCRKRSQALVVLVDLLAVVKYDSIYITGTSQSVSDVAVVRGHSCQLLDSLVVLAAVDSCFISDVCEPYWFLR